jgi:mRNA interferase MazF
VSKRGEIYWVDFGTPQGSEPGFRRPALIVQNDIGNRSTNTTIVAVLTTRILSNNYPHIVVVDPKESGLNERSAVLLHQLMTVDQNRLEEKCGDLNVKCMTDVDNALRAALALD